MFRCPLLLCCRQRRSASCCAPSCEATRTAQSAMRPPGRRQLASLGPPQRHQYPRPACWRACAPSLYSSACPLNLCPCPCCWVYLPSPGVGWQAPSPAVSCCTSASRPALGRSRSHPLVACRGLPWLVVPPAAPQPLSLPIAASPQQDYCCKHHTAPTPLMCTGSPWSLVPQLPHSPPTASFTL